QYVHTNWFGQHKVGAGLEPPIFEIERGISRYKYDRQIRSRGMQAHHLTQGKPVKARHHDVKQHTIRTLNLSQRECFSGSERGDCLKATNVKDHAQQIQRIDSVINYQDTCHDNSSLTFRLSHQAVPVVRRNWLTDPSDSAT